LHDNGIMHRDLKLENVLVKKVDESDSSIPICKITDYGMCTTDKTSTKYCGT